MSVTTMAHYHEGSRVEATVDSHGTVVLNFHDAEGNTVHLFLEESKALGVLNKLGKETAEALSVARSLTWDEIELNTVTKRRG